MPAPLPPEPVLLCVLRKGPDYGKNLADRIRKLSDLRVSYSTGALYPSLRRLETRGLVRSRTVPPPAETGGRPRRIYTLTSAGQRLASRYSAFFLAVAEA